jgi:shikimate kinase/3-dehydroquinate synthase
MGVLRESRGTRIVAPLLALTGFMGSGKSAVGLAVAQGLGWRFIDLDQEVERALGMGIADYFASEGEGPFRAKESEILEGLLNSVRSQGHIVALGGGTLEKSGNLRKVKQAGRVVLLHVSAEEAWARVVGSARPLAQDEAAFGDLWRRRVATYEGAADWIVPTVGRQVDEIASEVMELVEYCGSALQSLWVRSLAKTSRCSSIVGGRDALQFLGAKAQQARESGSRLHVVTDVNVMKAWGERALTVLGDLDGDGACVLQAGEESKSASVLERCWDWLAGRKAMREDIVVALGGGVVGDLAGLVAATYHRGMGLWQVPTSLLAQVDSSVGGKTAINLSVGKNLVGAFYPGDLVVIDPDALATLPEREYFGALGEVVKHALLASEEAFDLLERQVDEIRGRDTAVMSDLLKRNVWFKASVVEEDERESGRRAVLNLGHTTAHALESTMGYGHMNHGQAVALGLLVALSVSERVLGLDRAVRERTEALLAALGLETSVELPAVSLILAAAGRDKKVKSGTIGFVGLRSLGQPEWGLDVSSSTFAGALEVIRR